MTQVCVLMTSDAEGTCTEESQPSYEMCFKLGGTRTGKCLRMAWEVFQVTDVLYVTSDILHDISAR